MTEEMSKDIKCILMRSGIEIWLEDDRIENLKKVLMASRESKFIELNGEVINTADITGIFSAGTMQDVGRRKNGQWKDSKGNWHDKGERICPTCKRILPYGKTCGYCG